MDAFKGLTLSEDPPFNDEENKLSLVIRLAQDGKTGICISIIVDEPLTVHIIVTMNTLSAGMQFFGRLEHDISSERIIVMNSDKSTAGKCHHAKNATEAKDLLIKRSIQCVICCAHKKRFCESIPELLKACADSIELNSKRRIKFKIHIDEAHAYIKSFREEVYRFNAMPNVISIIGYTASPDPIWDPTGADPLFGRIKIYDTLTVCSEFYYGVKDTVQKTFDHIARDQFISNANIEEDIPEHVLLRSATAAGETKHTKWYGAKFPFQLGDEHLFLAFTDCIVKEELLPVFSQDRFSYHFVPSCKRKATQYFIIDICLKYFPQGNVIVMNGDGMHLYRRNSEMVQKINKAGYFMVHDIPDKSKPSISEPAQQIQALIKGCSHFPTFVTGLDCVGMSVTLIDENIRNFDSVIFGHAQLDKEQRYQLCRFVFNYGRWKDKSVKTTQLFSLTKNVLDVCLGYEQEIITINRDFQGLNPTIREIQGLEPYLPHPDEIRRKDISLLDNFIVNVKNQWKRFKVYGDNDDEEEQWALAHSYYEKVLGKALKGKSLPKKIDGFYYCSTTGQYGIKTELEIDEKRLSGYKWSSFYQLREAQLRYARVFVGYADLEDPTEYTIYIKYSELRDDEQVQEILKKHYPKKKPKAVVDSSPDVTDYESD
jgi:hypothetical protein